MSRVRKDRRPFAPRSSPAEPIIKEVCVEILPSCDESDGDEEEADGECEQDGADQDRARLVAQLEATRLRDGHHPGRGAAGLEKG